MRAVLLSLVTLAVPAAASAQTASTDPETLANFDRAAVYWNATPQHCVAVELVVYQPIVGTAAARGDMNGCYIYVGDYYLTSASPARRCAIITHEWGHLTGHPDGGGLPDDPSEVMASGNAMPPLCSPLDPPPAPTPSPAPSPPSAPMSSAPAQSKASVDAYIRWARRTRNRSECRVNADMKRHRAARVAARHRCVRRYGRIGRAPLGT